MVDQLKDDGSGFGISDDKITAADGEVGDFRTEVDEGIKMDNAKEAQTKTTTKADKAATGSLRDIAQEMKKNDNYKPAVGERYGIVGDEIAIDVENASPALEQVQTPYGWELRFNLQNYFTAVDIFRKRPDEDDFSFKATDTSSPYPDTDPMENGTEYYAYYKMGDLRVGKKSDIITIEV
jgi:hypothetical protein